MGDPPSRQRANKMWPVFLFGAGCLLALLFLPGVVALRKTESVYQEIRRIQDSHRDSQRSLAEIERRVYLVSIAVREALLDTSPASGGSYQGEVARQRLEIERHVAALKQHGLTEDRISLPALESELARYFGALEPVFQWTTQERASRAMFFLREQQRPRRQSVIEIAEQISRLTEESHARQLEQVNQSQISFGEDIRRVIAVAFLAGLAIAAITIVRMFRLEEKAERNRLLAARAEDELRNLSIRLRHTQEAERKTISRELHDEVGQSLTALRMGLGALERLRNNPSGFDEQLVEVKTLAEGTLRSVRDIAVGLRPSVLDLGLLPALQWQCRQFAKYSDVPATVQAEGDLENVPEEHRTCIYRVVQECLTNAAKHAGASIVRVEIREVQRVLEMAVHDNGAGLGEGAAPGGLGLLGMEERVRELGGTLTVKSDAGAGTTILVRLRLPAEE